MATQVTSGGGMTNSGDFIFPQLSQGDIIKRRMQEQNAQFQKLVSEQAQNLSENDRGVFQAFAQLGQAVGGKPAAELTQSEKQHYAIMEKSNEYMKEQMGTEEWKSIAPEEKALRSQDAIARAAFDVGAVDIGSAVSLKTAKTRIELKRAETEQTGLEKDLTAKDDAHESATRQKTFDELKLDAMNNGEAATYVVADKDGKYNFDNPTFATGKVGTSGMLKPVDGGEETANWLPLASFTAMQTNYMKSQIAGAKADGNTTKALKDRMGLLVGEAGKEKAKAARVDASASIQIMSKIADVMEGATARGADPRSVVGTAGAFNETVGKVFDTAAGVLEGFSRNGVTTLDENGKPVGFTSFSDLADKYSDKIALPENMQKNSSEATAYRSAVMQALYLDARLEEPGARQLSDADIAKAAERLGIQSNDPATIFTTIAGKFKRNIDRIRNGAQQYRTAAAAIPGLNPGQAEQIIYGGTMDQLDKDYGVQMERFNKMLPSLQEAQGKPAPVEAPKSATTNADGLMEISVDENGNAIQ